MRPSDHRDLFLFEDPIRAEILSYARFEQLAETLANSHLLMKDPRKGKELRSRVASNRQVLQHSYFEIVRAVEEHRAITPAGEWFIDNFHVVRSLLQDIREHLPKKFYQQLPKLADGPFAGLPRVYALAWEFIAHTDSHFDGDLLRHFLKSYQKTQPLLIGELWAIPITLRVVMIENLRRLAVRIAGSQIARHEADEIANEILGLHGKPAVAPEALHEKWKRKHFIPAFSVQLLQRFRFQDASVQPLLKWIEEELLAVGQTPDSIISLEHSRQTAANASVRNLILSARTMSSFNWHGFFEEVSLVETTLRKNSLYGDLDFQTRDCYRRMVEEIAKSSHQSEIDIAEIAVAKSSNAVSDTKIDEDCRRRSQDVGYFLIDKGRAEIEQELNVALPLKIRATRFYIRHATLIYLSSLFLISAALVALPFFRSGELFPSEF